MRVRVPSVFVTKFYEALGDLQQANEEHREVAIQLLIDRCEHLNDESEDGDVVDDDLIRDCRKALRDRGGVPDHLLVEEFLTRMAPDLARVLKHQLLEALLAETAARLVPEVHSAGSTEIPVDSSPVA